MKLNRLDRALLESAWEELACAPRARVGESAAMRSACFSARCAGVCRRCGRPIQVGQWIRYHDDFDRPVHDGCRALKSTTGPERVTQTRERRTPPTAVQREPVVCGNCHLEHAGECW